MHEEEIRSFLRQELSIQLSGGATMQQLLEAVKEKIQVLIDTDFQQLINVLYRIDVSEHKLKRLLKENHGQDTALIISNLVIERQIQKAKSRAVFNNHATDTNTEEKW